MVCPKGKLTRINRLDNNLYIILIAFDPWEYSPPMSQEPHTCWIYKFQPDFHADQLH